MSTDPNDMAKAAAQGLPDTLVVLVVAVVVAVLLGLAFPGSAIWVFPFVAMFGFYISLLGVRCGSYLSVPLGLSPFALFIAGLAMTYMQPFSEEERRSCTRLTLGLYAVCFVPLAVYVSGQVRRWGGPAPPLIIRITRTFKGLFKSLLALFILGAIVYFVWPLGSSLLPKTDVDRARVNLNLADQYWGADQTTRAIQEYKTFLSNKHSVLAPEFKDELPRVFRRVIEHEVQYGSPGEAVDWIVKAIDMDIQLSFQSEEARELWAKVSRDKGIL